MGFFLILFMVEGDKNMYNRNYFLIKIKKNQSNMVIKYLNKEGFTHITGGNCPWVFIDIDNKEYRFGKAGICYGNVIGGHAIRFCEFRTIFRMYKKYNGLEVLDMGIRFDVSFKEYLELIAEVTKLYPISYGLHLATSGKVPMSNNLRRYLRNCYQNNISITQAIEDWI